MYLHLIPDRGMAVLPLEIAGVGTIKAQVPPDGINYGQDTPGLAFIQVKANGLPALRVAVCPAKLGKRLACTTQQFSFAVTGQSDRFQQE
jgi:hypothetical protein